MLEKTRERQTTGARTVFVNELTNGILDPAEPMLGPVADGGVIIANTAPGCWGPMITPEIRGGHEVTRPVAVAGAEVGDAVAIRIRSLIVTSAATASGNSFAAPVVAGHLARIVGAHPGITCWQARTVLATMARNAPAHGEAGAE